MVTVLICQDISNTFVLVIIEQLPCHRRSKMRRSNRDMFMHEALAKGIAAKKTRVQGHGAYNVSTHAVGNNISLYRRGLNRTRILPQFKLIYESVDLVLTFNLHKDSCSVEIES